MRRGSKTAQHCAEGNEATEDFSQPHSLRSYQCSNLIHAIPNLVLLRWCHTDEKQCITKNMRKVHSQPRLKARSPSPYKPLGSAPRPIDMEIGIYPRKKLFLEMVERLPRYALVDTQQLPKRLLGHASVLWHAEHGGQARCEADGDCGRGGEVVEACALPVVEGEPHDLLRCAGALDDAGGLCEDCVALLECLDCAEGFVGAP
jgi:hypothetical protein